MMMNIVFNGQTRQVAKGMTLDQLLEEAGVPSKFCAVESNLEIVTKSEYQTLVLKEGDSLEVVTLVGGG